MRKYEELLKKASNAFNEEDLIIGSNLADECCNEHIGYPFCIRSLNTSKRYDDENMYKKYNTSKKEYWDKLKKLDSEKLELYLEALKEYCNYLNRF